MANKITVDDRGNLHDGKGLFSEKENSAPPALDAEALKAADHVIRTTSMAVAKSYRLDPSTAEDIAQDTWVSVLTARRDASETIEEAKLLKAISRQSGTRYTVGYQQGLRHEDFQARRALLEAEAVFERDNGRKMTKGERDEAAEALRMSFPPGRRPKPDFHNLTQVLSIDAEVAHRDGLGSTSYADTIPDERVELPFDEQEDAAAQALHEYETGGTHGKVSVRRDMWRIVSIRNGAPQVKREHLSSHAASKHRRLVEEKGSIHTLAQRWIDGEATPEEESALFAPFGELNRNEMVLAAEVFEDHPQYADALWHEALKGASR